MEFTYVGDELSIFQHATNWKTYFGKIIRPYFGNDVLEVGAGTGATTIILCSGNERSWVCLEPDAQLAAEIEQSIAKRNLPSCCRVVAGETHKLDKSEIFDSILYIDVLEHIKDDAEEIRIASRHLRSGGHLIVLSPAHQFLYTPFYRALGHFRRYTKRSLAAVAPTELELRRSIYLDSVGALASLANKTFLRQSMPTENQILFWDRQLVPLSRVADRVLRYNLGKTLLGIWQKN